MSRTVSVGFTVRSVEHLPGGLDDDEVHAVAKLSVGARREFPLGEHFRLALGALYTFNDVDRALAPSYGGGNPTGATTRRNTSGCAARPSACRSTNTPKLGRITSGNSVDRVRTRSMAWSQYAVGG